MADIWVGVKWLIEIHAGGGKKEKKKTPQTARNRLQLLIVESSRARKGEKAEGHKTALCPRRVTREGER